MHKRFVLPLILVLTLLLVSCVKVSDFVGTMYVANFSVFAMDTFIEIKTNSIPDKDVFENCETIVRDMEKAISKTIPDSDVYKLNNSGNRRVGINDNALTLMKLGFEVNDKTNGAFDITLEPVINLWNLKSENFVPPQDSEISNALTLVGCDKFSFEDGNVIKNNQNSKVDLGGIGKGLALEKVTHYLNSEGLTGVVSFGGSIGVFGEKENGEKWSIAIKSPFDETGTVGTLKLERGFVSVSGAYERNATYNGVLYHHIIDPYTGYPAVSDIASSVVICDSGALSDALSTALFVMGSERSLDFYKSGEYDFEAIIIKNDGEIILTDKLKHSGDFTPETN